MTGARPAVFVDKDGTLIVDVPYNADPARVEFMPGAFAALRRLDAAGYAMVVVTNQPGIAAGRIAPDAFERLERHVAERLRDEAGVALAGFVHCPHAPGPDGGPGCECRKPAPGMLRRAASDAGLDLARSWMVGDILDDVEAGRAAGCRTVLLDVGNETVWRTGPQRTPHHVCAGWDDVARLIVAETQTEGAR